MPQYRKPPAGSVAAYAPASEGPFMCSHCEYINPRSECRKPELVAEAKALRNLDRTATVAQVESAACCDFFEKRR